MLLPAWDSTLCMMHWETPELQYKPDPNGYLIFVSGRCGFVWVPRTAVSVNYVFQVILSRKRVLLQVSMLGVVGLRTALDELGRAKTRKEQTQTREGGAGR